jgi:hypothetical protein
MFGSYVVDRSGFPGHLDRRGAIGQIRAMARSDAEEVSAVLSASVVIQTEVAKVAHVAQALSDVPTGTHVSRHTSLAQDVTAMRWRKSSATSSGSSAAVK